MFERIIVHKLDRYNKRQQDFLPGCLECATRYLDLLNICLILSLLQMRMDISIFLFQKEKEEM